MQKALGDNIRKVGSYMLVKEEDLLAKLVFLHKVSPRVGRVLRGYARLQQTQGATASSPLALQMKKEVAALSALERMKLLEKMSAKLIVFCESPKTFLPRQIIETFAEDGSLWFGNPQLGFVDETLTGKVAKMTATFHVDFPDTTVFAEPIAEAILVNRSVGLQRLKTTICSLADNVLLSIALTDKFAKQVQAIMELFTPLLLGRLRNYELLQVTLMCARASAVIPSNNTHAMKILFPLMPAAIRNNVHHSDPRLAEIIRLPLTFRVRHTPTLEVIGDTVTRAAHIMNVPLFADSLQLMAEMNFRHDALEALAVAYTEERLEEQLLLDQYAILQLSWALLALRGTIPERLVSCVRILFDRFIEDSLMPFRALLFVEQLTQRLPPEDDDKLVALLDVLLQTARFKHASSRRLMAELTAKEPDIIADVQLGPYFVHGAALVDRGTFKPWPESIMPEDVTPLNRDQLPGVPVALLAVSVSDMRLMKPGVPLGCIRRKKRQLEAVGWHVAIIVQDQLSQRGAIASALRKAAVHVEPAGSDQVEDSNDVSVTVSDHSTFETYSKDFLSVLFAKELGLVSTAERSRSRLVMDNAGTL